ncbi:hypothetical protein [Microbacterium sp. KR10-403]|uniref:hypothetical protein n=1 Tax=Microbacterium sp. KR10-403 TaxID=3158581 RepID=UPI0032E4CD4C
MKDILCGQSEPLRLTTEVVPLHDFSLPGAPVVAWRTAVYGEHISPNACRGPRRERREDAERDLAEMTGAAA